MGLKNKGRFCGCIQLAHLRNTVATKCFTSNVPAVVAHGHCRSNGVCTIMASILQGLN
jgi:hypothetical protein